MDGYLKSVSKLENSQFDKIIRAAKGFAKVSQRTKPLSADEHAFLVDDSDSDGDCN